MHTPTHILKQYWGYDTFRPLQEDIINSVLGGGDTMALLPTGAGKSLCYQLPALMMDGICLVISPLIALMQDQVSRLAKLGIPAACIYSGMNYYEVKTMLHDTLHGAYKILYISPERLQTRLFTDHLSGFHISMVAIDEAHCISQWGHDFRPDYLKLADIKEYFHQVPLLALTATATSEVAKDIIKQLKLNNPKIFQQSFARDNIFYEVRYTENKNADVLKDINKNCSIIYCRSRRQTEAISKYLGQNSISVTAYHAGMAKERRSEAQQSWMEHQVPVIAATTAFGMGIDKPDVRMVLHYDAPENIEAYYQEAGRAGRDSKPSQALCIYNSTDITRLRESVALQFPPEEYLRKVYQSVAEYLQIPSGNEPNSGYPFDLNDFCKKFLLVPAQAIHALKLLESEGLWTMSEAVYHPATVQFTAERQVLDDLSRSHPDLVFVTTGLLRMYSGIFQYPVTIRESAIAKTLKMKKDEVMQKLGQLAAMGLIDLKLPGEGAQLFFHHRRVDSRHLLINTRQVNILKKRHEAHIEAMISFLQNTNTCREKMILAYFGEDIRQDCGHCDICRDKQYRNINTKQLKEELLEHIKQQNGITTKNLLTPYPIAIKDKVIAAIRSMMDEGIVALTNNMILYVG